MIVILEQVKDLYNIETASISIKELINLYDKSAYDKRDPLTIRVSLP